MRLLIATLGLVIGLTDAAAAQDRRAVTLSDWKPPAGVRCGTDTVNRAPPIATVFDTAGLRDRTEAVWRLAGDPKRHVLLTLGNDAATAALRARALETRLADSITAAVVTAAEESAWPVSQRPFRLRIDGPAPLRFALGDTEECAPALRNRAVIASILRSPEIARALYDAGMRVPVAVTAEFVIDGAGRAEERLTISPSLNPEVDRIVEYIVRESLFYPGMIERVPVRTLVRQQYHLAPLGR